MTTMRVILQQARRYLADVMEQSYAEADLIEYAAEGIRQFASRTLVCLDERYLSVSGPIIPFADILRNGQSAVLEVWRVYWKDGDIYRMIQQENPSDYCIPQTAPSRWLRLHSGLRLDIVPEDQQNRQFGILYSYLPEPPTSADSDFPLQDLHIYPIVLYIVYAACIQTLNSGMANGMLELFERSVKEAALKAQMQVEGVK